MFATKLHGHSPDGETVDVFTNFHSQTKLIMRNVHHPHSSLLLGGPGGSVVSVAVCGPRGHEFDAVCVPVAQ